MKFKIGDIVVKGDSVVPDPVSNNAKGLVIGIREADNEVLVYWQHHDKCLWTEEEQLDFHD